MKSFSQRTKESLLQIESSKKCCRLAEMAGIALFAGRIRQREYRIFSELEGTIKRFIKLADKCFGRKLEIHKGKANFFCGISDSEILSELLGIKDINVAHESGIPEWIRLSECCAASFLRGAFLGGGTMVDPNKNYNLEFLIPNEKLCEDFIGLLDGMGLNFKKTLRKGTLIAYVKNSEIIGDFLAHMGAFSSQMELINIKIEKEIRNDMNRAANGETANMDKVLTASAQQIKAIHKIDKCIGLENIPEELREVAILRGKHKDISLERLGKMLTPQLSKSGVNHRIKRLMNIAENL